MPRRTRITDAGYYHVMSRGVERCNVYLEDEDYRLFLDILVEVFKKYNIVLHSYYLYDDIHFWIVAKYIEGNPIKAKMITSVSEYKYQSFFQWKFKKEYLNLIKKSKIFEMTLHEYEEFISTEMKSDISDTVFATPKLVKKMVR